MNSWLALMPSAVNEGLEDGPLALSAIYVKRRTSFFRIQSPPRFGDGHVLWSALGMSVRKSSRSGLSSESTFKPRTDVCVSYVLSDRVRPSTSMRRNRRQRSFSSKNVKRSKKAVPRSRRISKHHTDQKHSQRLPSGTRSARSRKRKQNRRSPLDRTHGQVVKAVEASNGSSAASEEDLEIENALCQSSSLPTSKLMSKFEERLRGGHFRFLNQRLYLSSGKDSWKRFKNNESLFHEYHLGYLQSMQHWSVQPVDVAIRWLQKQTPHQKVVDYGCGDARIMKTNVSHVRPYDISSSCASVTSSTGCDVFGFGRNGSQSDCL